MNADFNEMMRYTNARNSLRTLKNVADFMAGMRGRRKAVVYFSEGIDYDTIDVTHNPHATDVQHEMKDLVASATRGNVNIYPVDPRGVTSGMEDAIEMNGMPATGTISPTQLMDEMRLEHDSLRTVAEETGGFRRAQSERLPHGLRAHPGRTTAATTCSGTTRPTTNVDGRYSNIKVQAC